MNQKVRSILRQVHLWLGLILGLPFVVIAFTGSLLVFYIEIDSLLHPGIRGQTDQSAPGWSSPVWDEALRTVQAKWPGETGKWSFEVTGKPGAIPARYYPPSEGHDHHTGPDPLMVWISPDGRQVLREAVWGDYLMTFFYDVHRNLLAGAVGNIVVGWLGVATLFLLLTGLVVWWPRGSWRKAIAYKPRASPIRRLYDLHKLIGLGSLFLLLILSGTGALLGLPAEKNWLLDRIIAPVVPVPSPASTTASGTQVPVSRALAAAHAALPDARLAWVDVPGPGDGVFRVRAQVPGDPTHRFPYSFVFVDQYSGTVLAVHDARNGTASTTVSNWLRPLHDASVGGLATRILGVIVGFAPLALFTTGILRWRRRGDRASSRGA
ncbi:PepSY-associated TM helix domain-containing protein [Caulobacter sp. 73W]|uniref:PepSY-associated TM helix domain-containing protein n=1 Tax=Caulobacter sp. 73W TaxID=3161137 RepID=A0AB39KRT9_9CAUL